MWRPARLRQAADLLRAGGLIAYPTEAVYGLGCDPFDRLAVERLCRLKQRSLKAGLILIAADLAQLPGWIDPGETEWQRLSEVSAVPTTWVVKAGPLAGNWITGGRTTIAVRISQHALARELCTELGSPLVSTSANRRGRRPARDTRSVRQWFGADIDLILPGPTGGVSRPSAIRVAATGEQLRSN
ncbi:MAG: L-threonylcarbamoyladenylate synthase [Gammaproteobacteria bacterium]